MPKPWEKDWSNGGGSPATPATPAAPSKPWERDWQQPSAPTRQLTKREQLAARVKEQWPSWLHPVVDVGEFVDKITDIAMQGLTLGASEEVGALGETLLETTGLRDTATRDIKDVVSGAPAKSAYAQTLEAQRAKEAEFRTAHPIASTAAEITGALGGGGPAAATSLVNVAKGVGRLLFPAAEKAAPVAGQIGRAVEILPSGIRPLARDVAKSAAVGAGYGGAAGFAGSEGGEEARLEGLRTGAGAGGAIGGGLPLFGAVARKTLRPLLLGKKGVEKVIASETAGISPTVPMISGSRVIGGTQQFLSHTPFAGGVIERRAGSQLEEAKEAAEGVASIYGAAPGAGASGEAARRGLKAFSGEAGPGIPPTKPTRTMTPQELTATSRAPTTQVGFENKSAAMYEMFDRLMPADRPFALTSTRAALADIVQSYPSSAELSQAMSNPRMRRIAEALEATDQLTFDEIKQLRTQIGEEIKRPGSQFPEMSEQQVNQLYGALSDDMAAAAKNVSPEAERTLQRATDYYRGGRQRLRELASLTGKSGEELNAEQVYQRLWQAAQGSAGKGDITLLMKAKRSMPPEQWGDVSAGILREIGRPVPGATQWGERANEFSPVTFMRNYSAMGKDAKNLLFGMEGSPLRERLNNLVGVFGSMRQIEKLANLSNTAQVLQGGLWGLAGLIQAPLAAKGVVAANIVARGMMNPQFVHWLANTSSARTGRQVAQQVARLPGLAKAIGWTAGELTAVQQAYAPYMEQQPAPTTQTRAQGRPQPAPPPAQPSQMLRLQQ